MSVTPLDDSNFAAEFAASERAVVDFYAGWCGPCILFKPKFARISNDYPAVRFFLLDGEKSPVSRKTVTIGALPFFGFFEGGRFVDGISTSDESAFRAFVDKHLATQS